MEHLEFVFACEHEQSIITVVIDGEKMEVTRRYVITAVQAVAIMAMVVSAVCHEWDQPIAIPEAMEILAGLT